MGIFVALLVLSVLIFFHELGHFTVARFFKVQVDVFSIGFGKKIFTKQIGQTQWTLSLIPLGGYVKMKGQNDADPRIISNDSDSYTMKKPWQRIAILLGGPFANFLVAFLLYLAISFMGVPKLLSVIGEVNPNSPAHTAKLQKDDKIISINGIKTPYWDMIGPQLKGITSSITLVIERKHQLIDVSLTPKIIEDKDIFGEQIHRFIIGIKPTGVHIDVSYGFIDGIAYALEQTQKAATHIVTSVQKLITGAVNKDQLGGVITIVDITAKASNNGLIALFFFTALISVNLGILNLLPIPALDGGHIMFNLYEMITGKTANEKVMMFITLIGWALLIFLMLLGLYNDINRLIG